MTILGAPADVGQIAGEDRGPHSSSVRAGGESMEDYRAFVGLDAQGQHIGRDC